MIEAEVYIPVRYNSGRAVPPEVLNMVIGRLVNEAGGCTVLPSPVSGSYCMADGSLLSEDCYVFRVACGDFTTLGKVQTAASEIGGLLAQETVYVRALGYALCVESRGWPFEDISPLAFVT